MNNLFRLQARLALLLAAVAVCHGPARADDKNLPRVVLIGDSIRLGYAPLVVQKLAGKAVVISPKQNGGDSSNVLKHLDAWVIGEKPDLVHLNCGLHDLKFSPQTRTHQVPLEQYEKNLKEIVARIRAQTSAELVFALTTPIHDERHAKRKAGFDRFEADVRKYNAVAVKVMKEAGVAIHDLHAVVEKGGTDQLLGGDGTHYTPAGNERLAEAVAGFIEQRLKPRKGASLPAGSDEIPRRLNQDYAYLDALYKHLHANPELSLREEQTAARLARELRQAGCEVTEKVGGTGVVGLLKNGDGPTILIRADMDGLPIVEATGLPYASKVRTRDRSGNEVGVMHACGHDVNMTCLVGTARLLAGMRERWRGTLLLVGQPAEEIGAGARLMLADGLFRRFPRPDYGLALHCDGRYPHGHVNYRAGQAQANVDSVDVLVKGKGGHGAAPHTTVDPIVLAARIVLNLQTITSRELDPTRKAVVTVGSIHGGTKHNIIPGEVKLQLTVRTTTDADRRQVLEAIERIVRATAEGARAPEPVVTIDPGEFTPALVNDPALTRQMVSLFAEALGPERVHERPMSMGGEDFSRFGREGIPTFYWWLGSVDPDRVAEARQPGGRPLPVTHSDSYYPVPEPTIKTGVQTMTLAVLKLAGK